MEPTQTPACPRWAAQIMDMTDGEAPGTGRAQLAAHLQACPACAQAAREVSALRRALAALPPRATSPQFEASLAARLADRDAQRARAPWWTPWAEAWRHKPRAARPVWALGAAAMTILGAALFGHPAAKPISMPPASAASDPSLVSHCVEQHRTEAAAQPLSDLSAQNLAAQVDGVSPADANANMANEDGL